MSPAGNVEEGPWLAGARRVRQISGRRPSVEVLLGRYAKCLDGRQEVANNKIDGLLREYE